MTIGAERVKFERDLGKPLPVRGGPSVEFLVGLRGVANKSLNQGRAKATLVESNQILPVAPTWVLGSSHTPRYLVRPALVRQTMVHAIALGPENFRWLGCCPGLTFAGC